MQVKPGVAIAVIVIIIVIVAAAWMGLTRQPKMPDSPYEGMKEMGGPVGKGKMPGMGGKMPQAPAGQPQGGSPGQ